MRIAAVLMCIVSLNSWAGNKVGNGGDVLSCASKTQLLDFYEADGRGRKQTTPATKSYMDLVNVRLDELNRVAPKLSAQYKARAQKIEKEIDFRSGIALADVQDSLHVSLPADESCKLKQIAIRQDVAVGEEKRFVIDKGLWEKLDTNNQAGLILHEIIYEHFSKLGESDSRKARRLNALLFSDELSKMSSGKFWLFVKELSLPVYP